jgi:TPP-dependent pyruvate/acetoin dehydrogenase alpha subunit
LKDRRVEIYRWLVVSRELEAALCVENPRWFPAAGEEATIVGAFADLRPGDAAAPHYRGPFVVYLMRGAEMWRLCCQALGRRDGYNKGRSVPFTGPADLGFVPWVAGDLGTTLGVATGAALAFQQAGWLAEPSAGDAAGPTAAGEGRVCVCTFGDGTANRGDFHENVNLAACWRLPIVYVCQHNGWSISQPAASYLPAPVSDRARGYGIPGVAVDGNDVEAVRAVVGEAVARARRGDGPTLIEARTWRQGGHWAGDAAAYRDDLAARPDDPLEVLAGRLVARGDATEAELAGLRAEVAAEVAHALARARQSPEAGPSELGLDEVLV